MNVMRGRGRRLFPAWVIHEDVCHTDEMIRSCSDMVSGYFTCRNLRAACSGAPLVTRVIDFPSFARLLPFLC